MYVMTFHLKPTAGMTFRILPGSILDIATYPFVPPTTLSGFLRRLAMLSVRLDFPNTGPNDENTPFYALPRELIALGAYPIGACTRPAHRTYRKGPRDLGHTAFSAIFRGKAKSIENIQLHTWEYLIAEDLIGYVASENGEELNRLAELVGYGAKIGKEGFAYLVGVDGPFLLKRAELQAIPSTIALADEMYRNNTRATAEVYPLYSFVWQGLSAESSGTKKKGTRVKAKPLVREYSNSSFDSHPSPIIKYKPFVAALVDNENQSGVMLDFWHNENVFIPASLLDILQGEVTDEA